MNNPLGVSPSKGSQVTTRGKEKIFGLGGNRTHDLRIRSTVTLPTELRGRTEKVGDDIGGESRRRESQGTYLIPFTRANAQWVNAQWVIHGFISTLIYTSELILCFTICVLSATRHNIHMFLPDTPPVRKV